MNGVSQDLKLAIAVHRAGAMPSLMPNNLEKDVKLFKKLTGNTNLVISVSEIDLYNNNFVDNLIDLKITFVELMRDDIDSVEKLNSIKPLSENWYNCTFLKNLERLKSNNIKIMRRCFKQPIETFDLIDAVCIKGKESAGFSSDISVEQLLQEQKAKTPDAKLITYGGIAGPDDVKKYLDLGADAVGVGTLFAASVESCIDIKTKQLMVSKTKKDLTLFQDTKQNAMVIEPLDSDDDFNRHKSLDLGIRGIGGHIYAGYSINGVTEIRTVKQTVDYLVTKIK